jgi:hypothetical protein
MCGPCSRLVRSRSSERAPDRAASASAWCARSPAVPAHRPSTSSTRGTTRCSADPVSTASTTCPDGSTSCCSASVTRRSRTISALRPPAATARRSSSGRPGRRRRRTNRRSLSDSRVPLARPAWPYAAQAAWVSSTWREVCARSAIWSVHTCPEDPLHSSPTRVLPSRRFSAATAASASRSLSHQARSS